MQNKKHLARKTPTGHIAVPLYTMPEKKNTILIELKYGLKLRPVIGMQSLTLGQKLKPGLGNTSIPNGIRTFL